MALEISNGGEGNLVTNWVGQSFVETESVFAESFKKTVETREARVVRRREKAGLCEGGALCCAACRRWRAEGGCVFTHRSRVLSLGSFVS
jgi:hypothetical protein